MVRAAGFEPARAKPNGFSYQLRLSPPSAGTDVRGLDYPFTMPCIEGLGAARLVSTPSPGKILSGAWLGIAISQGSPNLSSSAAQVSPRAPKR